MDLRRLDIKEEQQDTCKWLLEHKNYRDWLAELPGLLWIKGKPGTGKSTLMNYGLRKFREQRLPNVAIASFFFHGTGTQLQRTALGLFRSLLHQILEQNGTLLSEFTSYFNGSLETRGEPGSDWDWHIRELQDFFQSNVVERGCRVRIFLDALDECDEHDEVLDYFKRLNHSTDSAIGICFSSRHSLRKHLDCNEICVENGNSRDISTYIQAKLEEVGDKAEFLKKELLNKAYGVFQWVDLMLSQTLKDLHNGISTKQILDKVQNVPSALDGVYRRILKDVCRKDSMNGSTTTLYLMLWVYLAARPLSLTELRFAMALGSPDPQEQHRILHRHLKLGGFEDDEQMENLVESSSGGLVEVKEHEREKRVQFIHQSVRDFLMGDGIRFIYELVERNPTEHNQILDRKSRYISLGHSQLSVFCLGYATIEDVGTTRENYRPFLEYAATYWVWHAQRGESALIPPTDLLAQFKWPSNQILQRWLETYRMIDPLECPEKQSTLLHIAARYGLISTVELLLSEGSVCADDTDGNGRTPLSLAAERGYRAVVGLLLEKGVDADSRDVNGRTPLLWAVENGHETIVEDLLRHIDNDNLFSRSEIYKSKDFVQLLLRKVSKDVKRKLLPWAAGQGNETVVELLLEMNIDADTKGSNGRTPLSLASEKGHDSVVSLLLKKNIDIDAKDISGRTPLSFAAEKGHGSVVTLLLLENVDVDAIDTGRRTPLSFASEKGHNSMVALLLEKNVDADVRDIDGRAPLSFAAEKGHDCVVTLLLEKNVDAEAKDTNGRTPLWWAALNGHDAIIKLLLKNVDANAKHELLLSAASQGDATIVELLLERSTDADTKDSNGRTPLSLASENGHSSVVTLLLAKNVNVGVKDTNGWTPLRWAALNGHATIVKLLLEKVDVDAKHKLLLWAASQGDAIIVKLLLAKNVDAGVKDTNGRTPLWWAALNGHATIVELLLEKVDVDAKHELLLWAASQGDTTIVKLLVAKNVDADAKDIDGRTPLSFAAEKGHNSVVMLLLLEENVNTSTKDTNGRTPLWWAALNGHDAIIKLLLKKVDVDAKHELLLWAASQGDATIVELLLTKNVDAGVKDANGWTPLWWAALNGHATIVELLLEKVDIDAKHKLLLWAASQGDTTIIQLLMAKNVDAGVKDTNGWIPLWWAALNGHATIVKLLLEKVDVNAKHKLLLWAANQGDATIVKLLLAKNVNAGVKDTNGRTPLWWAALNGHATIVELLLEKVDVDAKHELLLWAASQGDATIIKLLLENNVNAGVKDTNGRTPLWWAALNGHDAIVKLFLEKVDVDVKHELLLWAASQGNATIVKLLVAKNVNVDATDIGGRTPVEPDSQV